MNYSKKYLIVLWSFLINEGSWYFLYNTIISPSFVLTFSINRSANSFLHFFINFALVSVNHSSINSFPISAVFLQSHIFIRKSTWWNLTKIDFVNEESAEDTHLSSTWARFDDSMETPARVEIILTHSFIIPFWKTKCDFSSYQ